MRILVDDRGSGYKEEPDELCSNLKIYLNCRHKKTDLISRLSWLREPDLRPSPRGYKEEPDELCSNIKIYLNFRHKKTDLISRLSWLREPDLNRRPSGYEPDELPGCSIPRPCITLEQRR
jgi:hypothetical protein